MYRYLALFPQHLARPGSSLVRTVVDALHADGRWTVAHDTNAAFVAYVPAKGHGPKSRPLAAQKGAVIGDLFVRGAKERSAHAPPEFSEIETDRISQSRGSYLIDHYWGRYFAVFCPEKGSRYSVFRDPTCQMPCYCVRWSGIWVYFSHVADVMAFLPIKLRPNWHAVTVFARCPTMLTRQCAVEGVQDVPGGERHTIGSNGVDRHVLWSPARVFHSSSQIESPDAARAVMREAVDTSIATLASCYDRIVVSLSGGLDSSIVATSLARAVDSQEVTAHNFYLNIASDTSEIHTPYLSAHGRANYLRLAGHADERVFARLVSQRCGFRLIEDERRPERVDLPKLENLPPEVSPRGYVFLPDLLKMQCERYQQLGAEASFTGQGGDTVFYATSKPYSAIDYAYAHPFGKQLMTQVRHSAAISRESFWGVLVKAINYGVLRRTVDDKHWLIQSEHFLSSEAAASGSSADLSHPWMKNIPPMPPGKHSQLESLSASGNGLFYHHDLSRDDHLSIINPLLTQLVVEACIQVPMYIHLLGGVSRGLARVEFSDVLPPEVVRRTSKGSGGPFLQSVVSQNMAYIAETLIDGILVRHGILDPKRLATYLVPGQQFRTVGAFQILMYLEAELWARTFVADPAGAPAKPATDARDVIECARTASQT